MPLWEAGNGLLPRYYCFILEFFVACIGLGASGAEAFSQPESSCFVAEGTPVFVTTTTIYCFALGSF